VRPFERDEETSLTFVVTPEMGAGFGGRLLHPVLATATLTYYAEWAARLLLEPHLEPGEEGVGVGVCLVHEEPAPFGSEVRVRARSPRLERNRLTCAVEAWRGELRLARGEVVQAIVDREVWRARLRRP
jgi:fluoroacetyl-CoA thioesterase